MSVKNLFFHFSLCVPSLCFAQTQLVQGKVEGFPKLNSDDVIHGAIVLPALSPRELLGLQIENLLGPNENMSAGPETLKVPGNLFIPNQRETYGIFPISLSKPKFSAPMNSSEARELYAIQFRAPFTKLVDLARKKAPYTDIVSLVSAESCGLTKNVLWSEANSKDVSISLSSKVSQAQNFTWNRAPVQSKSEFDIVLNFQKTPNNNWVPVSFLGKVGAQGQLNFTTGLSLDRLSLFTRITHDSKNSPIMTQVRFYRGNDASQTLAPQGLPTLPVEWLWNPATSKFSWKNEGAKKGWVNLIRKNNNQYIQSWMTFQEPLSQLFARLSDWAQGLRLNWSSVTTLGWFPIDQGEVTLQPGLQENESLVFVQVETSENVLKPDEDISVEPQLFSLAEGLVIKTFDALK